MPGAASETTPLLNPPPYVTPIMNAQAIGTQDSHQWPARSQPDDDSKPKSPRRFSWAGLKRDITKDHTDIPIIACCFASGLCDSSAFNAWNTFVSMQTGTAQLIFYNSLCFLPSEFLPAPDVQPGVHRDHLTHTNLSFPSLSCPPSCTPPVVSVLYLYPYSIP